jgi:flagellar basal body-associated protein FliL
MVAIIVLIVINTIISLTQVGLFYFYFVRKKPSLPQERDNRHQEAKEETQKTFLTEKQLREWLLGEGK